MSFFKFLLLLQCIAALSCMWYAIVKCEELEERKEMLKLCLTKGLLLNLASETATIVAGIVIASMRHSPEDMSDAKNFLLRTAACIGIYLAFTITNAIASTKAYKQQHSPLK